MPRGSLRSKAGILPSAQRCRCELVHTLFEPDVGPKTDRGRGAFGRRKYMANVAQPRTTGDDRSRGIRAERTSERDRHVEHGVRCTTRDVERAVMGLLAEERGDVRA